MSTLASAAWATQLLKFSSPHFLRTLIPDVSAPLRLVSRLAEFVGGRIAPVFALEWYSRVTARRE